MIKGAEFVTINTINSTLRPINSCATMVSSKPVSKRFQDLLTQQGYANKPLKGKILSNETQNENEMVEGESTPKRDSTVGSLIPQADTYLDNGFNVLLIGLHGTGKTQSILDLTHARGMTMKYYSCSTLDPYTDLVGVPVPKQLCVECDTYFDQNTVKCPLGHETVSALKMVRPREVDEAEFIFFDEFNRADPKTLNAIFEIIQFKSINGEPLRNLKCCWAAMNPPEDQYQVEEVDPALLDRFDVYLAIDPHPSVEYMSKFMDKQVASALFMWWTEHGRAVRQRQIKVASGSNKQSAGNSRIDYVSPRRLLKIGQVWEATKNSKSVKAALPIGGTFDTGKLIELLKAAGKPGGIKTEGIGDAASSELTYASAWLITNRKTAVDVLKANPNNLETHRKVLDTLQQGVGGQPLVEKYGEILDAIQPSLLEGFFNGMPEVKKSQMRKGFTQLHKTNRNKARELKNLHGVLSKGARTGNMPDIS
jgi:hypothetical protein